MRIPSGPASASHVNERRCPTCGDFGELIWHNATCSKSRLPEGGNSGFRPAFYVDNASTWQFRPISGAIALVQTLVSGLGRSEIA